MIPAGIGTKKRVLDAHPEAVGGGVVAGLLFGFVYTWIIEWLVRRSHPEAIMVAVGGIPLLLVAIIGFVVGFVWMVRL